MERSHRVSARFEKGEEVPAALLTKPLHHIPNHGIAGLGMHGTYFMTSVVVLGISEISTTVLDLTKGSRGRVFHSSHPWGKGCSRGNGRMMTSKLQSKGCRLIGDNILNIQHDQSPSLIANAFALVVIIVIQKSGLVGARSGSIGGVTASSPSRRRRRGEREQLLAIGGDDIHIQGGGGEEEIPIPLPVVQVPVQASFGRSSSRGCIQLMGGRPAHSRLHDHTLHFQQQQQQGLLPNPNKRTNSQSPVPNFLPTTSKQSNRARAEKANWRPLRPPSSRRETQRPKGVPPLTQPGVTEKSSSSTTKLNFKYNKKKTV